MRCVQCGKETHSEISKLCFSCQNGGNVLFEKTPGRKRLEALEVLESSMVEVGQKYNLKDSRMLSFLFSTMPGNNVTEISDNFFIHLQKVLSSGDNANPDYYIIIDNLENFRADLLALSLDKEENEVKFVRQIDTFRGLPVCLSNDDMWVKKNMMACYIQYSEGKHAIFIRSDAYAILQKSPKFKEFLDLIYEHEYAEYLYATKQGSDPHSNQSDREDELLVYLKANGYELD